MSRSVGSVGSPCRKLRCLTNCAVPWQSCILRPALTSSLSSRRTRATAFGGLGCFGTTGRGGPVGPWRPYLQACTIFCAQAPLGSIEDVQRGCGDNLPKADEAASFCSKGRGLVSVLLLRMRLTNAVCTKLLLGIPYIIRRRPANKSSPTYLALPRAPDVILPYLQTTP